MFQSPVKVNRRRSCTSVKDQEISSRKRLFASEPPKKNPSLKHSLRVAVLKKNYKQIVLDASAQRKQNRIEKEKLKSTPSRRSLNFSHNPYESKSFLLQQVKEKSQYIQKLELDYLEVKAKRHRTEAKEEQMKSMLDANKTYLNSILSFFKNSRKEEEN